MRFKVAIVLAVLCLGSGPAFAGVYTDDLSRCLVESSTQEDKTVLVHWVVAAITQHPSVSLLGRATESDIDTANAAAGALFMKLLTDVCADKSKKAIKYEGVAAIQTSFGVLGQVAAAELFGDPAVQKVMAGLAKHLDAKKLESLNE